MILLSSDLWLPEKDDFSKRYNAVTELYQRTKQEGISEEERDRRVKDWFSAKYCLEQGLPIAL